jgi:hypothetical protein
MSKLDEELRAALKREEPSADFAYRVLAQVRALPPPKPGWRQSLLTLLRPPKLVWVAAGLAACLLIALGVQGLRGYERAAAETEKVIAGEAARPAQQDQASTTQGTVSQSQPEVAPKPEPEMISKHIRHHRRSVAKEDPDEMEARKAMEQLELALYIASTKLNAAQKAVYKVDNPEK